MHTPMLSGIFDAEQLVAMDGVQLGYWIFWMPTPTQLFLKIILVLIQLWGCSKMLHV